MMALGDMNRLGRLLFRGGVSLQVRDPTGVPVTREEVMEVLAQLRQMMDRVFDRFSERSA